MDVVTQVDDLTVFLMRQDHKTEYQEVRELQAKFIARKLIKVGYPDDVVLPVVRSRMKVVLEHRGYEPLSHPDSTIWVFRSREYHEAYVKPIRRK